MINPDTQAILLLCLPLSETEKPLTQREYHGFATWLAGQGIRPGALLEPLTLPEQVTERVTRQRIEHLMRGSAALAILLERWGQMGLWVLSRADADYPARLKERLRGAAPPFLFGAGPRELLARGGVAVAGSRKADADSLRYAERVGKRCASEGLVLISGGAVGIDREATSATLAAGGKAVSILADSLESKTRPNGAYLRAGQLAMVSPFAPSARFFVARAMERNKLIYALSDLAIIPHSGTEGGTWAGASENLKHGWVPLFVRPADGPECGNRALLQAGGKPLSEPELEESPLCSLLEKTTVAEQGELFASRALACAHPVRERGHTLPLTDLEYPAFLQEVHSKLGSRCFKTDVERLFKGRFKAAQLARWYARAIEQGELVRGKSRGHSLK